MSLSRNGYMLNSKKKKRGYDWWWHSLIGTNSQTGELEPFFIEYYIINPGFGSQKPIFGETPSYCMIKAGKWGENKAQLHNFWGIQDLKVSNKDLNISFGHNIATETTLRGSVNVSLEESKNPDFMCDKGSMSWDLNVQKTLSFSVGYGASKLFRMSGLFSMFWHVQGMKALYDGEIIYNNTKYIVKPETSYGYQDKNWGINYTNPWIWLNCNNFITKEGQTLQNTSLDIGGGNPKLAGISLGEKILVKFVHELKEYEFNFTHIFFQRQKWLCTEDINYIYWDVRVQNRTHILEVKFKCNKDSMIKVNYVNPYGIKHHQNLWNGGYAHGDLTLIEKKTSKTINLKGSLGGCEYGRYSSKN